MIRWQQWAAGLLVAAGLVGCGGGGGGDSGGGPALTFEPNIFVADADPGISSDMTVRVRPNFSASGTVYLVVIDNQGVITSDLDLFSQGDGSYLAQLHTAQGLPAGRYTGRLEVRVCPVASCAQQFAGSPVFVPYDIRVGTPTNLTALSRQAGVPEWETHQGNASHTGYVPITVNAANFSVRWRWAEAGSASPVTISNDTVYVTAGGGPQGGWRLVALNEHDASERWRHAFGALHNVNPPAVSGGSVYAASSGHQHTAMWALDAATGALRFSTPFGSQWERYFAPTVRNGRVYTNGGSYGGVYAFDTTTGDTAWFTSLAQYDEWTPAVDDQYTYASVGGVLTRMHQDTGIVVDERPLAGFSLGGSGGETVPVLPGGGRVLVRSHHTHGNNQANTLHLVHPVQAQSWSVTGVFHTDPVVAGDTVFIGNGNRLEARSLATGALQWSTDVQGSHFTGNLVVTDSHVFLSSNILTFAVNRSTRRSDWMHTRVGMKAISPNGVLYISTTPQNGVTAINLR